MVRRKTSTEDKREKARLRKRRQRARAKNVRANRPYNMDAMHEVLQGSFADFLSQNDDNLQTAYQSLHAGGIIVEGDLAKEDHIGVYPEDSMWEDDFQVPLNSINRSIVMIGGMIDAMTELAKLVNQYKTQEINRAIEEAELRKAPMIELEKLYRFKNRLRKYEQVRLPTYFVDGS